MHFNPLSRAVIAGSILASAMAASGFAQTSYPLICRGGGDMRAVVSADGSVNLSFQPGGAAGSSQPPSEGQCTWLDRGFRGGEPARLLLKNNPGGAKYLVGNMVDGRVFYVHVFNNRQGAMEVTRIGP